MTMNLGVGRTFRILIGCRCVMNKEQVKGATEKIGGKVKEEWGKVTGNPATEQKGRKEQAEGQLREEVAKIKDDRKHSLKH